VAEGLLVSANTIEDSTDYEYMTVELGHAERSNDFSVSLVTPIERDLYFERDNGRLKAIQVTQGQRVKKDDVIAEIVFDQDRLQADKAQLVFSMEQFELQTARQDAVYNERILEAREAVDYADENDLELAILALAELELTYEQFLFNNGLTREDNGRRLADLDEQLEGEAITAPFDGIITYAYSGRAGALVRSYTRMATIIDDTRVQFSVEASKEIMRYGTLLHIADRRDQISFEARCVSDPLAAYSPDMNHTYMLEPVEPGVITEMLGEGDVNLAMLQRFQLSATVLATDIDNTMMVPRRYVNPEDGKSFVYILEDDILKKRYVSTGITLPDGIQILDGLEPGQLVVLAP
jgi:multidrug efflux pump subunit AcrA (membrane-fusion protein)